MRKKMMILTGAVAVGLGLLATVASAEGTKHGKMFDRLDADHNGVVTQDEGRAGQDRFFARLDANSDGNISREEFHAIADRRFAKYDLDGNGEVTRDEAAQAKHNRRDKTNN